MEKAYARGALYDLGPYPAMCIGEDIIAGEVWEIAPHHLPETLRVLDEIEGFEPDGNLNLYERVTIATYSDARLQCRHPASAYVYRMEVKRLPALAQRVLPNPMAGDLDSAVAYWPIAGASPEVTSALPDPFADGPSAI